MYGIFGNFVAYLKKNNFTLATAESLTGGLLASSIVDIPGASKCFKEGFVTYCDESKMRTLGVPEDVIKKHGAISAETAHYMALYAAEKSGCDIGLSTTGNAGPDCDEGKPAGLVYIGVCIRGNVSTYECHFEGSRSQVRHEAASAAAEKCLDLLQGQ